MDRTDVNPWEWSKAFGFSQAVEMRRAERILICSGQTGIGEDGSPPSSADMGHQVTKAFENLGAVLRPLDSPPLTSSGSTTTRLTSTS